MVPSQRMSSGGRWRGVWFVVALSILTALAPRTHGTPPASGSPTLSVAIIADGDLPQAVKGYLFWQLREETKARVVDPFLADAVLGRALTPAYDFDGDQLQRYASAFLGTDALVQVSHAGPSVRVTVMRNSGVETREFPAATPVKAFADAAVFCRSVMGLAARAAPLDEIASDLQDNTAGFVSYYRSLGLPPYLAPTRDRLLRHAALPQAYADAVTSNSCNEPHWQNHRDAASLSARKIYNLHLLSLNTRADFRRQVIDCQEALAAVVGTTMEPVSYPLLSGALGKEFEEGLLQIAAALLPMQDAELDSLVNGDTDKNSAAPPVEFKPVGRPFTRAQRLGAMRALGCIATTNALKTLLVAAASKDADVREAAAFSLAAQRGEAGAPTLRKLAADADPVVARAAMLSLWHHGAGGAQLLPVLRAAPDTFLQSSVLAAEAFAQLAAEQDKSRLRDLQPKIGGGARLALVRARFRLGDIDTETASTLLRDEDPEVIADALHKLVDKSIDQALRPVIRRLASHPIPAVAEAASAALLAHPPTDPGQRQLLRLECGSPYDRLSILTGVGAKRDQAPAADLLEKGMENSLPLIRFESLRLLGEHFPQRATAMLPAALRDSSRWVRMQAAAMACDQPSSALADALKDALSREASDTVRRAMQAALAKATGAGEPPATSPAHAAGDDRRLVWTDLATNKDLDHAPIDGYLCKFSADGVLERGKHVYHRFLWGQLPDPVRLTNEPEAFDGLWCSFDNDLQDAVVTKLDACDLRILGLGTDWESSWRDFCREAGIDSARVGGDITRLNTYEKRAFDSWTLERGISGFSLLYDLIKLHSRFRRPGLQVASWALDYFSPEAASTVGRWKCDLGWSIHPSTYLRARMFRTLWPERPYVYHAPAPGGVPAFTNRFDSPMPTALIFESTNRTFSHTLLAWLSGAHLELIAGWRFVDPLAATEGDVPSIYLGFNHLGPDRAALDRAIEHAFNGAPVAGARASQATDPLAKADDGLELEKDGARPDPAARQKTAVRVGMRLMQKHLYDCARIFASLPRFDPKPRVLQIGQPSVPPLVPEGIPPLSAGAGLALPCDFLPSINMIADRDLSAYRLIVVHNGSLLRDETIAKLTKWLKDAPGLLLIHQNLTSDESAQASTVTDHSGRLHARWPWEKDMAIHPAPAAESVTLLGAELTTDAGPIQVTADTSMSSVDCMTPKAVAVARVGNKTVLARWRDLGFRGVVLFDGLRAPSKEYVARLAAEINAIAVEGSGLAVTDRDGVMAEETEFFQVAVSPGNGRVGGSGLKLSGVDLMSGAVDPTVGPRSASAIVPRKPYFHRYLACTPTIVALGEREFSQARQSDAGGLILQNAGVMQVAAKFPLQVARLDGKPMPAVPFGLAWVLEGTEEGVTACDTQAGSHLIFVRCGAPVVVKEVQQK